jgi:hypothetical protein
VHLERLSGSCGWEGIVHGDDTPGAIVSLQVEISSHGHRLYYGDTGVQGSGGTVEVL